LRFPAREDPDRQRLHLGQCNGKFLSWNYLTTALVLHLLIIISEF
jgi:hypothetical protein